MLDTQAPSTENVGQPQLKVGRQYEDESGPYEVLENDGRLVMLEYLLTGKRVKALASIKAQLHIACAEARRQGERPRWTHQYEAFFEALDRTGFALQVSLTEHYFGVFEDDYQEATGESLPVKYVTLDGDTKKRTTYRILITPEAAGMAPKHVTTRDVTGPFTYQVSSKAIMFELFRRGYRLGINRRKP